MHVVFTDSTDRRRARGSERASERERVSEKERERERKAGNLLLTSLRKSRGLFKESCSHNVRRVVEQNTSV